jgi:hypothetical protein
MSVRLVRRAGFEEFVRWYLARERQKKHQPESDLSGTSWDSVLAQMRRWHPGKLRPWFEGARWSIVSLDAVEDAMTVVCVDNRETRRRGLVTGSGIDNRLSRTVVAAAHDLGHFDNRDLEKSNAVEWHFRQRRIDAFRRKWPELRDGERLTICTLNAGEKRENPGGTYYLHDGFGRLLPFLYGILYEGRAYCPIEAFLADEKCE